MTEAEGAPSVVDAQDPLPESNWFFRRWCLLGSLAVLGVHRTWLIYHERPVDRWTDYLILSVLVLYTVAPSAEQVSKMLATVSLFNRGATLTKTASATSSPGGASTASSTATLTNDAGKPVVATALVGGEDDGELPPSRRVVRPSPLTFTDPTP